MLSAIIVKNGKKLTKLMISRLKNEVRTKLKIISRGKTVQKILHKSPLLNNLKTKAGKILWKATQVHKPLHGDPVLIKTIELLIKEMKIKTIVETGTYKGDTTSLLANMFPNVQIYTCEINEQNYLESKKRLKKYKNVQIYFGSSEKFLNELIKKKSIKGDTLFYLDAHWLDFWPLKDELKIISNKLKSAIIIIDDFKVPNDIRFSYDKYKDEECSLDMVNPNISKKNNYRLLFPKYGEEIFDKNKLHPALVGYPIIFQNMSSEFKKLTKIKFFEKFFRDESTLIKN